MILDFPDPCGVHNFSRGTLESYWKIHKLNAVEKVHVTMPGVLTLSGLPGRTRVKTFVFSPEGTDACRLGWTGNKMIKTLQHEGVIYSVDPLPALYKGAEFRETCYDLKTVFDPASYHPSKKRHQRLTYPFTFLTREGVTFHLGVQSNFEEISELHSAWCQKKLDDPKTFRMMFPSKRYIVCVENALRLPGYRLIVVSRNGEIIAVRVFGIQSKTAYDLAFFGKYWELPSQTMEYINVALLSYLLDEGIEVLNFGAPGNVSKALLNFKSHYPTFTKSHFVYPQLKEVTG